MEPDDFFEASNSIVAVLNSCDCEASARVVLLPEEKAMFLPLELSRYIEIDAWRETQAGQRVRYSIDVVYSTTYRLPEVFFNIYSEEGRPLKFEELDTCIEGITHTEKDYFFITQKENPVK